MKENNPLYIDGGHKAYDRGGDNGWEDGTGGERARIEAIRYCAGSGCGAGIVHWQDCVCDWAFNENGKWIDNCLGITTARAKTYYYGEKILQLLKRLRRKG